METSSHDRDDGQRRFDVRNPATANAAQQCMAVSVASPAPQSAAHAQPQQRTRDSVNISFDQLFESFSQTSGMGDLFTLENPAAAGPKVQIQPSFSRRSHLTFWVNVDENLFWQQKLGFGLQPVHPANFCLPGKDDAVATSCPFLKCTRLDRLDQEDVKFLEQRGCFTLLPKAVLDVFMKQYFLYIHPLLPIFNECEFWRLYQQPECEESSEHQLSLFTFQAMLAASSMKVPIGVLLSSGFASHQQACWILFQRAKHLYDFRTEEDPLAIAQGSLMLSLIAPTDSMHQDNTLWLNIAIQYTKVLRGYRSPVKANQSSAWPNGAQRLWHCCLIRDRILSLGMRRPLQIRPESYDASTAFERVPEGVATGKGEYMGSLIHDVDTERYLAKIHFACVQFAIMLTDLLMMVYPHDNAGVTPIDSLSDHSDFVLRVERCRSALDKWSTTFLTEFPDSPLPAHEGNVAVFFRSLLLMCHRYGTILDYWKCRDTDMHEITAAYFYPGYINAYDSQRLSVARSNIYDSIQTICNLTRRLQVQNLLSKLPPTA
ncbi:hypothetical protein FOPE_03894 [Fonsecaea pedrosoi]|nr:hypothetical protein FOPE_03894 [Fonsecaea pedrosoi]